MSSVYQNVYFGNWSCLEDIAKSFNIDMDYLESREILVAWYGDSWSGYEGSAFVLFRRIEGGLFEVHGGHCSCYGFEDQWKPEMTTWTALRHRRENGQIIDPSFEFAEQAEKRLDHLLDLTSMM